MKTKIVEDYVEEMFSFPVCNDCVHFVKGTLTCKAFPQRIPEDIMNGDNQHSTTHKEQKNNIVFTPNNTSEA